MIASGLNRLHHFRLQTENLQLTAQNETRTHAQRALAESELEARALASDALAAETEPWAGLMQANTKGDLR